MTDDKPRAESRDAPREDRSHQRGSSHERGREEGRKREAKEEGGRREGRPESSRYRDTGSERPRDAPRERERYDDKRDHRRSDTSRGSSRSAGRPDVPALPPPPMRGRPSTGSNLSRPPRPNTPPGLKDRDLDGQRGTPGSGPRKGGTPGASSSNPNPLFAELIKQGKLLASKTGETGSGDDDAEAGEILQEGDDGDLGGGGNKRRHSPIVWEPSSKVPRPLNGGGPTSILERSQQEAAALREMRMMAGDDDDIDHDAPAAMKASPSFSGSDQDEHEERARGNGNGSAASEDMHDAPQPKGVTSRWLTADEDDGGVMAGGGGSSPGQEPSQGVSGAGRGGLQGGEDAGGVTGGGFDSDSEGDEPGADAAQDNQLMRYDMRKECRDVHEFEKIEKISEGTYGVVYKAREKSTGRIVALKRVKMEHETNGFPLTSVREINILLNFHHPNIVNVEEVVVSPRAPDQIYMVMEYMDHDLKTLMEDKLKFSQPFSAGQVKCLMKQLLAGVAFLHANWVLHRDLKTSNILYNGKGDLKLCDFGMARQYGDPLGTYTHLVVTLWYRAPELLFGQQQYSTAVDVWSVGCIMGEVLTGKPLVPGQNEMEQIDQIVKLLGTPKKEDWPGLLELPNYKRISLKQVPPTLRQRFTAGFGVGGTTLTEAGFDLLQSLLAWDPAKRISAQDAMEHRWFKEAPLPVVSALMPTFAPRKAG